MSKVRKQLIAFAMAALFVLLAALLCVINIANFTLAAEDADRITATLSEQKGRFPERKTEEKENMPIFRPGKMGEGRGPMGPDSLEMDASLRYFTVVFPEGGEGEIASFRISAFTEEAAIELAESLKNREGTGWIKTSYRYRVFREGENVYVTVIDQGRELYPSYRILRISVIGGAAGLLISFLFLAFVSKKLFRPLEEADRKQKRFVAEAEREFKIPLTVMQADVELLERENGSTDLTASLYRQVKKMTALTKKLSGFALYETGTEARTEFDLSEKLAAQIDASRSDFETKGIRLETSIEEKILFRGDPDAFRRIFAELTENALKFAKTHASFTLKKEKERILLIQKNDADLPEGDLEAIFDRFTTLSASHGDGLGLSFVRDAVRSHFGRVRAKSEGGEFILEIIL